MYMLCFLAMAPRALMMEQFWPGLMSQPGGGAVLVFQRNSSGSTATSAPFSPASSMRLNCSAQLPSVKKSQPSQPPAGMYGAVHELDTTSGITDFWD
jgi:hypothetical protein